MKTPIEVAVIEDGTKYAHAIMHHRVVASHQGSMVIESVKLMLAAGGMMPVPLAEPGDTQVLQQMTPEQIVERAFKIASLTFERLEQEGLTAAIPAFADLIRESEETMGFRPTKLPPPPPLRR